MLPTLVCYIFAVWRFVPNDVTLSVSFCSSGWIVVDCQCRPGFWVQINFGLPVVSVCIFKMADPSERVERKRIVVFGATGRTGRPLVEQALVQGHYVTAIVRTPEKLNIQDPNLTIVKGDICDIETYATTLKNKDAVLSAFGSPYHSVFNPTTMYSESIKGIMEAMKRHKVCRLIVVTSWGTQPGPNNHWFMEWVLKPFILNGIIKDMGVMEKMVEKSDPNEINYTFVRPAGLTDDPPNGSYKVQEGYCNTSTKMHIPRADVAAFMLKCLNSNEYDRKGMAVASLPDK